MDVALIYFTLIAMDNKVKEIFFARKQYLSMQFFPRPIGIIHDVSSRLWRLWDEHHGSCLGHRAINSTYPLAVSAIPKVPEAHRRALLDQGCCDILAQGLIGLIGYSYQQDIPSFLEAHLKRTLG
jgi:hypothetical protein